ncbi:MAG: PKD domain-containing protein, partial [Chloroflexi bacterium]|nr:PKD domain-containing protein [Chloroflexota bacterium]
MAMRGSNRHLVTVVLVMSLLAMLIPLGLACKETTVVKQGPRAEFTVDAHSGYSPLKIQFADQSSAGVTAWSWDFDNDGIADSTERNPSHTYSVPGNYTVTLEVTAPDGSDKHTESAYIEVLESLTSGPQAAFAAVSTSGLAPLAVQFTDQSNGAVSSWSWQFGDGATSTERNPAHTYGAAGKYTVSLKASNLKGSDTAVKVQYIEVL